MQEGSVSSVRFSSSSSHIRQNPPFRWRDKFLSGFCLFLAIFFAQSSFVSLWNLWLSPILEISDRVEELDQECHSLFQPGNLPPAGSLEGTSHMVMYGDFRGPRDLCGQSTAEIDRLLALPHNCSRMERRVWMTGRGEWRTGREMLFLTQDLAKEEEETIECVIFCIDHQGPCQHDRCLVPVHMRRNSTDPMVAVQLLEEGGYDTVRPDMAFKTVLDAGGNCGISAIVFATMFPRATIVAVEPSTLNFRMLEKNTKLYPNVIPLRVGLWKKVARLALTKGRRTPGMTEWGYMVHELDKLSPSTEILDSLLGVSVEFLSRTIGISGFDLLKIDIEGSEKEVFAKSSQNPKNWLDSAKMAIVEVHEDMRRGAHDSVAETFWERDDWRWVRQWEEYHVYKKKGWDDGGGP